MAASDSAINTSNYFVEISSDGGNTWEKLGELTGCSLSRSHSTRETTDLYSGGATERAEGLKNWSLSGDGNVAYADEAGFVKPDDLHTHWDDRDKLDVRFATANTGDFQYSGKAYITEFGLENNSAEENQTYSITFEGSGALTAAAVS